MTARRTLPARAVNDGWLAAEGRAWRLQPPPFRGHGKGGLRGLGRGLCTPGATGAMVIACLLLAIALLSGCSSFSGASPCQDFTVPNAAMSPTFTTGEQIVIDTQAYASSTPRRGQEVVVSEPSNRGQEEVLRIIGLPGETVRLNETQTFINGKFLSEPFVLHRGTQQPMEVTLGPNQYFVMGDNRPQSTDSRAFGPTPLKNVVAEVGTNNCPIS